MPLRKQYVLISSDDRVATSRSTTDFSVVLREPINNAVKTELRGVSLDYNLANIISPNNTFQTYTYAFSDVDPAWINNVEDYIIPEDQYTAPELAAAIGELLANTFNAFDVRLVNRILQIDFWFPRATSAGHERDFRFMCSNPTLRTILGMTSPALTGRYVSTIGTFGGSRVTFNKAIKLPSTSPYILIQSAALGINTKTSGGLGFWRALVNDPANNTITLAEDARDAILTDPKRLQEIDIRLSYSNGAKLDNRGAAFALLLEVITNEDEKKRNTE